MQEQISAVAEWWAAQIFDKQGNWNNGDDSQAGGVAFLLGNLLKAQSLDKADENARPRFVEHLTIILSAKQKETGRVPSLYVDYSPDSILSDAAKRAGVSDSAFPCKSGTDVDKITATANHY